MEFYEKAQKGTEELTMFVVHKMEKTLNGRKRDLEKALHVKNGFFSKLKKENLVLDHV